MDEQKLKAEISAIAAGIEQATVVDAQSPTDKIFGALLLTGIGVVGELLLDVKRIADASGPPVHMHFHCPDGSVLNAMGDAVRIEPWLPPTEPDLGVVVERVARFLAKKDYERRCDGEPAQALLREWVDGNWPAFRDDATELLAAAAPDGATKAG